MIFKASNRFINISHKKVDSDVVSLTEKIFGRFNDTLQKVVSIC